MLNKGTGFTEVARALSALHGLLPPDVKTLDEQVTRRRENFDLLETNLERYVTLRGLQDSNGTSLDDGRR